MGFSEQTLDIGAMEELGECKAAEVLVVIGLVVVVLVQWGGAQPFECFEVE